jgi:hypothetical protein
MLIENGQMRERGVLETVYNQVLRVIWRIGADKPIIDRDE